MGTPDSTQRQVPLDAVLTRVMTGLMGRHHSALPVADQAINRRIHLRVAGCDPAGNELGDAQIAHDARAIDIMHAQHVMKPAEIRRQLANFQTRLAEVGGDWLKLTADEFAFLQLGGQTPSALLPGLLPEICRGTKEKTYALLLEYVDPAKPETRVPMAYNFGFTQLPIGDPRFPNMDPRDIARSNGKYAAIAHKILAIWRSGVLNKMDSSTVAQFAEIGITVPPELLGKSGRRRGLNNRFKPPLAIAALLRNIEWIIYNTVVATEPGNPALGMPNAAIRGSNEGVFIPLGVRNTLEHMMDDTGAAVADIGFDVFGNTPQSILNAELDDESVLMSKGGFESSDRYVTEGNVIAEVMLRRDADRQAT